MLASLHAHVSNGGSVDAHDIKDTFSGLKNTKTRGDAFEQLKTLLCNRDISAQSTSQEVQNVISYVTSHSKIFSEQQIFTIIDLALANALRKARQKESFLRLATVMSKSVSSGLNLCPNLKALASCQGTYFRLMDLLSNGTPSKSLNSEIFNAIRSIASQSKFFTSEQYCRVFTVAQKKHFRIWKKERSGTRTMDGDVVQESVLTYAGVVSSLPRLCENLRDPTSHQGAYLRLVDMLCGLRALESPNSELFDAVAIFVSHQQFFTSDQFFRAAACAMYSGVFMERAEETHSDVQGW